MSWLRSWKRQFVDWYCLRLLRRYRNGPVHPSLQERRDALLMNWLYWPKGNTPSCNEPPRYVPNCNVLKTIGHRPAPPLNRTKRTR